MQTINLVPFLRKTHGDVAFRKTPYENYNTYEFSFLTCLQTPKLEAS